MRAGMNSPDQLSSERIHGVNVRAKVAEIGETARADRDSCANACVCLKYPARAACRGVERIDLAERPAHEHATAYDCRLRVCREFSGKPEGPLKFQVRNLCRRKAGLIGR